ncbi:MAG TPA: hypothetical protein QF611_00735, partial [Pseudomonadales bacterium]|nr:hypothetical protein [Pseudomonadales bacterium]
RMAGRFAICFGFIFLLTGLQSSAQTSTPPPEMELSPLKLVGTTTHEPVNEMSGLVKSQRFPGVYWVHNDSGDDPRLFAIEKNGNVIIPDFMKGDFHGKVEAKGKQPWPGTKILLAANQDWEDIAIDEDRIYIADVGNNGNARRDMGIYVLYEPNPRALHESRILEYLPVRYPEQHQYPAEKWHFDSESVFIADGELHLLTKHRQPGQHLLSESGVNLYRLDSDHTSEVNILTKVDSHNQVTFATGADLSPDGSHLAVVSYTALWVFDRPEDGSSWLSTKTRMLPLSIQISRQIEAVCWDSNETILISNEQRQIFEIKLEHIPEHQPM